MRAPRPLLLTLIIAGRLGVANAGASELDAFLRTEHEALTPERVEEVAIRADHQYDLMVEGLEPPSAQLFEAWMDLAEYYKRLWEAVPEAQRERAVTMSDHTYARARDAWGGFEEVRKRSTAFEAAKAHLLYHVATHHAYFVQAGLEVSPFLAQDKNYWDAYNRLVPLAKEFRFMAERDPYVHAGLMEGANQLQHPVRRGEYDPTAAMTNVQQARWLLERAKSEDAKGRDCAPYVDQATERLLAGRQFGASRASVRDALAPIRDGTLIGKLEAGIDQDRRDHDGPFSHHVTIPFEPAPERAPVLGKGAVEDVLVTAEPRRNNPELHVLDELEALALQVAQQDSLAHHEAVKQLAPLLFHGLLAELVHEAGYQRVRELYLQQLPAPKRESARSKFPFLGRIVVTIPAVHRELVARRKLDPVNRRLSYVDSAELYEDLGELWSERAKRHSDEARGAPAPRSRLESALAAMAAASRANVSYIQASWRYDPDEVPSTVHLNVAATAQSALSASAQALEQLRLEKTPAMLSRLMDASDGADDARTVDRIVGQQGGFRKIVEEAYELVIDRGPALPPGSPGDPDEWFACYVTALARLSAFETAIGASEAGLEYAGILASSRPTNGFQFYVRGDARARHLGDLGAHEDFRQAYELLKDAPGARARDFAVRSERKLGE